MPAILWSDLEAEKTILTRGEKSDKTYITESGYGPSGFPHFGTFGEVVRTNFVMLALADKGYKTRLISFSDDMDPLRKVPTGFPDWLKEYIGKPISSIPDPFDDKHSSFSEHMNNALIDMLNQLGVTYEFVSSTKCYHEGKFNREIELVIKNYELVQEIVFPYLRSETQETWFPFFPICEKCGKIGTTRVTSVNKDKIFVQYICDINFGGQVGCGNKGEINPFNGSGKLQWRVDWAARWSAFNIDYEMYGKDLIETAQAADRIVGEVFMKTPPAHMFYELFLAEDGKKMSKSKGTGLTTDDWLKYGNIESLRLLLFDDPRKAKIVSSKAVERYSEKYQKLLSTYYDKQADNDNAIDKRTFLFAHLFNPPENKPIVVDFLTLCNLIGNLGISDYDLIQKYLQKSSLIPSSLSDQERDELHKQIDQAKKYYYDYLAPENYDPSLEEIEHKLLGLFLDFLDIGQHSSDDIQYQVFSIAKDNNYPAASFFKAIYGTLLRQKKGPRIGTFIYLIGEDVAAKLIRDRLIYIQSGATT